MTATTLTPPSFAYRLRTAIPISALIVAVSAGLANTLIALGAYALGLEAIGGLQPVAFLMFTAIAAVAGAFGWHLVNRYAPRPAATMRWLAPAFLAVSFVPDLFVGVTLGWAYAGALALMHIATLTLAVATYARLLPLRGSAARREPAAAPSR